jgi:hypothetical protein
MLTSNLKKTYKPNSFVISMETRKKKDWELSDEDKKDLGHSGLGAYLVEERDYPPPGY